MEGLQQMLAVLAVLGLLGGSLWWLRRRGIAHISGVPRRRTSGILQTVERLPLTPTHTLHLVRMADRAILIASSPAGCQVVESSPWSQLEGRQTPPESRP
jgi:flagellar biogenesis protein FliO